MRFIFLFFVLVLGTVCGWGQLLNRTLYNEKVYLSTDKDVYNVPDTILVKGFVVDAWEHRPDSVSRFVYIELVDLSDNVKERRKIRRDSLGFATAIAVDTALMVGNYYLRGYTQPMKYLPAEYIFTRSVVLDHRPREAQPLRDDRQLTSSSEEIDVRFFVEGGNRVNGVPQRIAFKCADKNGLPAYVEGIVTTGKGDTVAAVSTRYNGIGEYLCVSQPGEKYTFVASTGEKYNVTLPEGGPSLKVTAHNNQLRYGIDGVSGEYTLVIHAHGGVIHTQKISPSSSSGVLRTDSLKGGILCFSLFDAKQQDPVSERLYFVAPRSSPRILASRENDAIRLATDRPLSGDFVVTLTDPARQHNPLVKCGISSTFLLQSDLRDVVINPDYVLSDGGKNSVADMILLTERWGRFVRDIEKYDFGYTKETTEFISGRVKEGKPVSVMLVSSVLDNAYPLAIDKEGYFGAELPDFFGTADFYARPTLKNGKAASSVVEMRQDYFPEVRNPRKVLSSASLNLIRTETVRVKKSDYVLTPVNQSFRNEEGMTTYTTSDVTVKGRKRDTTFVDTKEFYKMSFMKQEDVLRYGKTSLAQAVSRMMNVAVVYVDNIKDGEFDFPHYEIFSKRGTSVFGLNPPKRLNGKPYSSDLSAFYCPMRVMVDGIMTDEDVALRMSPFEIESIERLTPTEATGLYGSRVGLCGVIDIKTATTVQQSNENRRTVVGGSVEKLGAYANLKSAYSDTFIPLTKIDTTTRIPLPESGKEMVLRIEGVTTEGEIVDFAEIM